MSLASIGPSEDPTSGPQALALSGSGVTRPPTTAEVRMKICEKPPRSADILEQYRE